jgi:hypothetical protein
VSCAEHVAQSRLGIQRGRRSGGRAFKAGGQLRQRILVAAVGGDRDELLLRVDAGWIERHRTLRELRGFRRAPRAADNGEELEQHRRAFVAQRQVAQECFSVGETSGRHGRVHEAVERACVGRVAAQRLHERVVREVGRVGLRLHLAPMLPFERRSVRSRPRDGRGKLRAGRDLLQQVEIELLEAAVDRARRRELQR